MRAACLEVLRERTGPEDVGGGQGECRTNNRGGAESRGLKERKKDPANVRAEQQLKEKLGRFSRCIFLCRRDGSPLALTASFFSAP